MLCVRKGTCLVLQVGLWLWTQPGLAQECRSGNLKLVNGMEKCCPVCSSKPENQFTPCANAEGDCKCGAGYECADLSCTSCKQLPRCKAGEEIRRTGRIDFEFICKPCKNGTFSKAGDTRCKPWTKHPGPRCVMIQPGNATHDAEYGKDEPSVEQGILSSLESSSTTIMAILTAVAIFILILMTFLLHLFIWSLKKEKVHIVQEPENNSILMPPPTSHLVEDTYSCQFPEEEAGDKIIEEKPSCITISGLH
ncbi:PREDICTED: tumor necrosis factor receptor superfamily member 18 [Gavialis gangeticus]|uniref:tumor necrosis factor receptor superfamily member 18 n=1 Tax=Gavialis gangeticus TaxID=94835 RepID=UPI00092FB067|nr:PREDICTED: tumor necrosis factor receptor superfamily member 18 [Gavialis gangeticus]